MKRAENFAIHLQQLKAFDQCDPDFTKALDLFSAKLTPSHSLTSRRYSIWSEVRLLLDDAFLRAIENYPGAWEFELLGGTRLSVMGKQPPEWRVNPAVIENSSGYDRTELRANKIDQLEVKAADVLAVDWQISNLQLWDMNLRYAIRSAQDAVNDPYEPSCEQFCRTLDSVRRLLSVLDALRPGRTLYYGNWFMDDRTRPQATSYCELCWRETKRWVGLMDAGEGPGKYFPDARWRKLSNRYCEIHDPSDPGSRYHADLPFRAAFRRELEALRGRGYSGFAFRFPLPNGADTQELRKTAYDQVHSRLRPATTSLTAKLGLREKIWILHEEGLHQAEIARRLGVSRQAVSKAWKSLRELVLKRQAEVYIDPGTGEPSIKPSVLAELKTLHAQGVPISEIARHTRLFKRTVQALVGRLD
ncbi:helix-turn-helix domain-containing protein [Pseudomonas sp. MH9.2]|uniref:helix-turn-helix domain-containing protein n=1 Tax=Pseudomonas sp. MH9.2 TaxID=3048629 RepID=UPI002AC89B46|nr:helix-turn-helix domain-containing protein [Pseudomonas sp. MH9.2]MEB0025898.1 helix-turn-helix domain-containing protein [Pseudomonas sp. MH9.2]WPX71335.1 helix-turn-helix domain-containing protein [Pseudomonas sp. MH9.2]